MIGRGGWRVIRPSGPIRRVRLFYPQLAPHPFDGLLTLSVAGGEAGAGHALAYLL